MPTVGELRTPAVVVKPVVELDGYGGFSRTWQQVGVVWASVRPRGTRRHDEAGREVLDVTWVVTIRHRTDIAPGVRLVLPEGRVLEVAQAYDPDGRRRWLELLCEEVRE